MTLLIHKIFVRVNGTYGRLHGGWPIDAMVDFTGGVAESYDLKRLEEGVNLHDILRASLKKRALIA